jgi:hypothetical protein
MVSMGILERSIIWCAYDPYKILLIEISWRVIIDIRLAFLVSANANISFAMLFAALYVISYSIWLFMKKRPTC